MERRICNAIRIAAGVAMLFSGAEAMSISGPIVRDAPAYPDATHSISLALRGYGTRYITEQQWASVSPYWHIFYGTLALCVVIALGTWGYQGFMKGLRSDEK